jgi:hypothetical protein
MGKQLCFNYNGVDYTLEFTRKSVEHMERQGFLVSDIADKPMLTLPTLFRGAFLAHHRFARTETIDEIFSKMTNKNELIAKLAEMYQEPIVTLMDEPEEATGNLNWTASW